MVRKIRWGILSTGYIANQFAAGLKSLPDAEIIAVGSRTQSTAETFGEIYDIPKRYSNYEQVALDPDAEVVYIGTPHSLHWANTRLCLQAGKHVLCEKPFTVNAKQAEDLIQTARERNLFLMEAMWTRFFPVMVKLRELLANKIIGLPRILTADFGFLAPYDPNSRLFLPQFGGGTLLDIGIYPLMLASMTLGQPDQMTGLALIGRTGVDEQSGFILKYPYGALALLYATFHTITPNQAILTGTAGRITLHTPWWKPAKITVSLFDQEEENYILPYEREGYQYEAMEVMQCIRENKLESEIMPLQETLGLQKSMDDLRAQWGVKYPMD